MADYSLGEYMAQAQRSLGGGAFGRTSGPLSGYLFGPDFFRKQTYLQVADTFVATYGKKVWDALNNKTVTFNAIKKVDWGPTVGWRLRTDRGPGGSGSTTGGRSRPVTETGALPTIDVSAYVGVYTYPKTVVSTFGVSLKSQAVSALEGGIGNQFAVEQEGTSRDHVKEINTELMAGSAYRCATTPTTGAYSPGGTYFAIPIAAANAFRYGDQVAFGYSGGSYTTTGGVISNWDTTTSATLAIGTITSTGQIPADGYSVFPLARAAITSVDDACMVDGALVCPSYNAKSVLYNLTTRTAGTYSAGAAGVTNGQMYNSGTGRDLTIPIVDLGFQTIRQNGGEPKLIVTGLDQYDNFNQLLQAQQRFVDVTDYIVGVGDDRTYPGTRAGFQLATYRGVPILPDPDTAKSTNTSGTTLGSNFYMFDTDYMEIAVMYPTQYVENRDYFAMNKSGELKSCYMLENPVYPLVPQMVTIYMVGTISREDCFSKQNPQRLYAGHSVKNEDRVRASGRLEESDRNDQIVPKCINCGKTLIKNQKKYCSKICQGKINCNIPTTHKIWNKGLTKEMAPKLSNSGVKKGNTPWNKNTKDLQIAWNKGLTRNTDSRVAKYGDSHKGHSCYRGSGNGKNGYREDLGHFVRSSWEANFCRMLQYFGIGYEYEPQRFYLGHTTYCPDIRLNDTNLFIEIKGYADAKWQKKLESFKTQYPEKELVVIGKSEYNTIYSKFSKEIENWE